MKRLVAPVVGADWLEVLPVREDAGGVFFRCDQLAYLICDLCGEDGGADKGYSTSVHSASAGCDEQDIECYEDQARPRPDWICNESGYRIQFGWAPEVAVYAALESPLCPLEDPYAES